jgi:hypothetical protein
MKAAPVCLRKEPVMPRPSSCRFVLALILAAVLLTPAVGAAAPRSAEPVPGGPGELISQLWGFLTRLWSANGFEIDPNGLPRTDSATSSANCDNGLEIDPSGRCVG